MGTWPCVENVSSSVVVAWAQLDDVTTEQTVSPVQVSVVPRRKSTLNSEY